MLLGREVGAGGGIWDVLLRGIGHLGAREGGWWKERCEKRVRVV